MAAIVSAAPSSGMDGNMLIPPDGLVKLKDKTIPVIEQVSVRWSAHTIIDDRGHLSFCGPACFGRHEACPTGERTSSGRLYIGVLGGSHDT